MGKVELNKIHPLIQEASSFSISSKLQEIVCLLAQGHVFEDAENTLDSLLNIQLSAKQIQRVSEHYGNAIEELELKMAACEDSVKKIDTAKDDDIVYGMMDGSMVFTREDGWKEMKVGRIFVHA